MPTTENMGFTEPESQTVRAVRAINEAVAEERERCAKIADETLPRDGHHLSMALKIAAAIRGHG